MPLIGNNTRLKIFHSENILKAQADVLVIPQYTNGQIPENFRSLADNLNLYPEDDTPLGEIDSRMVLDPQAQFKYVIYAATQDMDGATYAATREIAIKLGKFAQNTADALVVACNILGGGGELNDLECVKVIASAFSENSNKELHIYTRDEKILKSIDEINISEFQSTSSLKYAFRAAVIRVSRYANIRSIIYDTGFYYAHAKEKFEEYADFRQPSDFFFPELLAAFKNLWDEKEKTFVSTLAKFKEDSNEYKFLKLCGELVAYIDLNAANKNEWNIYTDKRVIAKSNVRQYDWICNLLQYRIDSNYRNIASSVVNAIRFLIEPKGRLAMLSNKHRELLLKNIYGNEYHLEADLVILFNQFELWGILATNPLNSGVVVTHILYSKEVEELWNSKEIEVDEDNRLFPGNLENEGMPVSVAKISQSIEPVFLTDYYAEEDLLNYDLYATAIAAFIKHQNTKAPLTIGIMAPWGKGKTSLMRFIKKKLDSTAVPGNVKQSSATVINNTGVNFKLFLTWLNKEKHEFTDKNNLQNPTIWFNAWKFQKNEQVWAGFAHEIIHQLVAKLPDQLAREEFWLRLNLKRIDQEKLRNKIYVKVFNKTIKAFIGFLTGIASVISSLILHPTFWIGLFSYGLFPFGTLLVFLCSRQKVKKEPIDFDIERFIKEPDYAAKRGYFHEVEDDLRDVMNMLIAETKPAVIFIDDLDRCSPNMVAEVVEAINLFISGDFPECFFILGQDAQMVAASLDAAYGRICNDTTHLYREQGSLGWHFMEKFVQLQFCIPTLNEKQAKAFFKSFFRLRNNEVIDEELNEAAEALVKKLDSDEKINDILSDDTTLLEAKLMMSNPAKAIEIQEKIIEKAAAEYDDNDPEIFNLINDLSPFLGTSPRAIKRFINLYRFYKFLQLTNRNTMLKDITSMNLGQWIIVMIRWPQLVRAIQWQTNEEIIKGANALERSKYFEDFLCQYSYREWIEVIQNDAPKQTWLKDKELYQFIHLIKEDNNSLDQAVLMGIW